MLLPIQRVLEGRFHRVACAAILFILWANAWFGSLSAQSAAEVAKLPALRILETATQDRFGVFGVKGAKPAPTLFIFATALEDLGGYTDVGRQLLKHGVLTVALDPPCHGSDLRAGEPPQLRGWRVRVEKGESLVDPFTTRATAVLDHLIHEGFTEPERVMAFGVSRGGFLAFHFAAADRRIKAVAAVSPVTRLSALTEFAGLENHKAVDALSVVHLADRLAGRAVWISIGNNDARVDTDSAVAFARKLATPRQNSNQILPVELIVGPSLGHHAIEHANELAADWLGRQLGF